MRLTPEHPEPAAKTNLREEGDLGFGRAARAGTPNDCAKTVKSVIFPSESSGDPCASVQEWYSDIPDLYDHYAVGSLLKSENIPGNSPDDLGDVRGVYIRFPAPK